MHNKSYKISFKNNSFVWLPARTGSTTLSWILSHFDFQLYSYDSNKNEYVMEEQFLSHYGHETYLPPTHNEMIFICSMRHPYERVLSFYKMLLTDKTKPTKEDFEKQFEHLCFNENSLLLKSANIFDDRIPDYVIKQESLYEDLLQIPFISNSKLNTCGILEEMCQKKFNNSFDLQIEEFISQENKEKIYTLFKKHFELFNYKK